jgi:hypothetical protein
MMKCWGDVSLTGNEDYEPTLTKSRTLSLLIHFHKVLYFR